jgi:formate dehydrogenase subunit gamma
MGALVVALAAWLPVTVLAQQAATPSQQPAPAAAPQAAPAPVPAPGSTAVPGWNNPPAWNDVSTRPQYASVPGRETNVLIQGAGHEWRKLRNGPITFYGGIVLLIPIALLVLFHVIKGPMRLHDPKTGRLVERFTSVERVVHWTMAVSFIVLSLTGLTLLFGKHFVLPVIGPTAFAAFGDIGKSLHNFLGPLFIFSLVIFIALFVRDNFFEARDGEWFANLGGLKSGTDTPCGRFNGGEKAYFWLLVVGISSVLSVTGLILDFPNWNQGREAMQIANMIHGIAAMLGTATVCFHIYLGTLGTPGALEGMTTGYVDETWAREHHRYWYDDVKAGKRAEKIVASGTQPATGD